MKTTRQSIEQMVINILQRETISTIKLIKAISAIRPNTTKQGVYRVLKKLKNEEKIVIHGKLVSLNLHWIKSMNEFFSLAQFHYLPKTAQPDGFLNIREKDKIVYFFKNLNLLDSFWSHVFHMFNEILEHGKPIFIYNPHEWFAYARPETEESLIKTMKKSDRQILITVAHDYPLDKELKKKFRGDLLQYDIAEKKSIKKSAYADKQNYYLSIFGDYMIEVFIDQKIAQQVDRFFKKTEAFDDDAKNELAKLVSQKGRNKLVISRNKDKAEKLKKSLSKNFWIRKSK